MGKSIYPVNINRTSAGTLLLLTKIGSFGAAATVGKGPWVDRVWQL